jgi:hypothetical protein
MNKLEQSHYVGHAAICETANKQSIWRSFDSHQGLILEKITENYTLPLNLETCRNHQYFISVEVMTILISLRTAVA